MTRSLEGERSENDDLVIRRGTAQPGMLREIDCDASKGRMMGDRPPNFSINGRFIFTCVAATF